MTGYSFHPDALLEYANAADFYLQEASVDVAQRSASSIEIAAALIVADPGRRPVFQEPMIRRHVIRSFPYLLCYRWDAEKDFVTILAVMHSSRQPGYWKLRIS